MMERFPTRFPKWTRYVSIATLSIVTAAVSGCGLQSSKTQSVATEVSENAESGGLTPVQPRLESPATAATKPDDAAKTTPSSSTATSVAAGEKPPLGTVKVLVPEKTFRREGRNKATRVTFNDLDVELVMNTKQLTPELTGQFPDWLKQLNGKVVRLKGYMHPASAYTADGIRRFTFCRDTSACCFGPNPTPYYLIETTMKSGESTQYIENKAFDVEGVLRIEYTAEHKKGQDVLTGFYFLDNASVVKAG